MLYCFSDFYLQVVLFLSYLIKKFNQSKREIRKVSGIKRMIVLITKVKYRHVSDLIRKESAAQVIINQPAIRA